MLWVKRRSRLKPVGSDPTLTKMLQWICVLLRVYVNFYRYWSFSWSKHIFFLPNMSLLLTANQKCCRNLPVDVKASTLIIFTADCSVLAKWIFQYKNIISDIFIIYFGCRYLIFVSHISGFICLYVQPTLWFNLTSTLFSLFHNSVFLLHIPFYFACFFFLFYNQHPGFPWLHYGSGERAIHYFLHTITHQNNTWLSGEILPAICQ